MIHKASVYAPAMNSSRSSRTVTLRKRPNFPTFGVYLGNDVPSGVYVVTVQPHSPAAQAKIQPGDRVLAVNDQLVSSMPKNAKDMIVDLAQHAQSLSLTIQSTDLFEALDGLLHSTVPVDRPASTVKPSSPIDRELEKFIKSIFANENVRIMAASTSNKDEYILLSDGDRLLYRSQPHERRKRKRRHHHHRHTQQTQTATNDENDEEILLPPVSTRSVPRMGTTQVLRQTQSSIKENTASDQVLGEAFLPKRARPNAIDSSGGTMIEVVSPTERSHSSTSYASNVPTPTPVAAGASAQLLQRIFSRSTSEKDEGLRHVYLRRLPDFPGFGFHVEYNQLFYRVQHIEPNSPAQRANLLVNDVIRKVNKQRTETMTHDAFVEIVNHSAEVHFLVQTRRQYESAHPQLSSLRVPVARAPISRQLSTGEKFKNGLSRALNKLKGR